MRHLTVLAAAMTGAILLAALPTAAAAAPSPVGQHGLPVSAQEGEPYPPMTLERINAHRLSIIDEVRADQGKAYHWSLTFASADGTPLDGIVASTQSFIYAPATGKVTGTRTVTREDGTVATTDRYRCVRKNMCWAQQAGQKWKRLVAIRVVARDGDAYTPDYYTVLETLSENSALLGDAQGNQTATITLDPGAMTYEAVANLGNGMQMRGVARIAVAPAPRVSAPAKKSVQPGKPTITHTYIF